MKIIYIIFIFLITGCHEIMLQKNIKAISITGKKLYQEHEPIQFQVNTNGEEGYIYLFHMNSNNKITLIYPKKDASLVKMNGNYSFPRDFENKNLYTIKDCKECSVETTDIYAFLAKKPITNIKNIISHKLVNFFDQEHIQTRGISISMFRKKNINLTKFTFIVQGNHIIGKVSTSKKTSSTNQLQKQINFIKHIQIQRHYHRSISNMKEAQSLKNIFTYVLFPRKIKGGKSTKKYQRYAKVLELIQELSNSTNNDSQNISKIKGNQFILMRKKLNKKENITVESYNYELATQIIDFLRTKLTASFFEKNGSLFFNEEGPFFITLTERNLNKKDGFGFLYLDLSTFNESAITQVIESYKKRLVKKGDKNIDTLEEWHYQLLSAITNFNDNFHFFNVAYAGDLD